MKREQKEVKLRMILQDYHRRNDYELQQAVNDILALDALPPAGGAEEIDDETIAWAAEHQCGTPFSERWIGFVKGAKWHRSLHAQKIADKMVEERLEQYKSQFKDRPNPQDVNPNDSKGYKRIRNRKITKS